MLQPTVSGAQAADASAEPHIVRSADGDERARSVFPLRVGAIDVGSNAIRFLAAEFRQPTKYVALEQVRMPVRLGHDVFLTGRLPPSAVDAAIAALVAFHGRLESLEIGHYRAVATSAVRDSENRDEFLDRVRAEAGIAIEIITGAEEARLVHQAVRNRVILGQKKWVLADLGGGSVEVSLVDDNEILWSVSHDMGSVRLLEELSVAGDEPGRFRRRLQEYTATLRMPATKRSQLAGFIATGGNIESLAKLAAAEPDDKGISRIPLQRLREMIELLARLSYRQRVDDLGLREDRADVILPAAMVYERLCVLAGFDTVTVPNVGVKDGVVLDLVDDVIERGPHRERQDHVVFAGAIALGKRFHFDLAHGRHVANLAVSLFDQLQDVHGLTRADRRMLMAAALLHDVGVYIAYKRHHKHSLYIISQSELPGFTPSEILMVANIARYHRKGEPADSHEPFMELSGSERTRVTKLAGILRLADALDREHKQAVRDVASSREDGNVWLSLQSTGDLLLERWAVHRKAGLFERTFGLKVRIHGDVNPA
jgi:exopolyphosphatase/guanosine-5'-triphosphate,3'-diphosphate pyrophosphatase